MSPRVPRVTGKEMIKFLQSKGFEIVRIRGSHHALRNKEGLTVIVPVHRNERLGIGLIKGILKQAQIPIEDFIRFFGN